MKEILINALQESQSKKTFSIETQEILKAEGGRIYLIKRKKAKRTIEKEYLNVIKATFDDLQYSRKTLDLEDTEIALNPNYISLNDKTFKEQIDLIKTLNFNIPNAKAIIGEVMDYILIITRYKKETGQLLFDKQSIRTASSQNIHGTKIKGALIIDYVKLTNNNRPQLLITNRRIDYKNPRLYIMPLIIPN